MTKLLGHHTGTISTSQLFVFSTGSSTTFYTATAKPVQNHFYMGAVHFYTTNSKKLVNCTYWGAVGISVQKNDKKSRTLSTQLYKYLKVVNSTKKSLKKIPKKPVKNCTTYSVEMGPTEKLP